MFDLSESILPGQLAGEATLKRETHGPAMAMSTMRSNLSKKQHTPQVPCHTQRFCLHAPGEWRQGASSYCKAESF